MAFLAGATLSGCTGVVAGGAQDAGGDKDAALGGTSKDGAADGGGPIDGLDAEPVDAEALEAGRPDAELSDGERRDAEVADAAPRRDASAVPDAGPRADGGAPAWLASMNAPNTLYGVGEIPSDVLPGRIQWPGAGANNRLESGGSDNNPLYLTSGYGGSVFVPELGPWGTMIFGATGEHSVTEQLLSFGLSEDSPSWRFFQQPLYATSAAEADTFNADWYFNQAEFDAMASWQKLEYNADSQTSADWLSTWATHGKSFPIGYDGWIARRKYGAGAGSTLLGNTRPHWFRYSMPCYLPPSLTGDGAGALLVNSQGTIYGPYNSGPIPSGASDADWYAERWPSGARKDWLYAMNVETKEWTRLPEPVPSSSSVYGVAYPQSAVDAANRRVYYVTNGGNWALYYADLSAGLRGMTMAAPTDLINTSGETAVLYNSILCVPSAGGLAGRRLWFFQDAVSSALILIDIDANTMRRLPVANLPGGNWRFGYDQANNVVYLTTVDSAVNCSRFVIPDDFTNAAAYSVETLSLNMNGHSVEAGANLSGYGQRSMFLNGLGVILVPMKTEQLLAFRPN